MKVLIAGVAGKMGAELARAIVADKEVQLAGGANPGYDKVKIGDIINNPSVEALCYSNLDEAIKETQPNIIVDFTTPAVVFENACKSLENGIHCVIGTTGLTKEQREYLAELSEKNDANVLIAPNFSLGAVMMMKVSAELAPYFPDVEIIELHHNNKLDAPSGTSKLTAELINAARDKAGVKPQIDNTKESLDGARGANLDGIAIHSVRLPGYVAHQEVLFGGYMETLSIRHDSLHRSSFMPGVILACKKISAHKGLTYGLEHYL